MYEAIQQLSVKENYSSPQKEFVSNAYASIEANQSTIQTSETLVLEQNVSPYPIIDNQEEPVYDLDSFSSTSTIKKAEAVLAPPPNFNEQMSQFPKKISAAFKEILNADIIGIWPIKTEILLRNKNLSE